MLEDSFVPEAFGRNQKGMQPGEALEGDDDMHARMIWLEMRDVMAKGAAKLAQIGVHKQYANRLIEPFSFHTAVITATDVDNLFHLRVNPLAQGEFQKAARMMLETRDASKPLPVNYGDWHLPYVRGVAPESRTPIFNREGAQVGAIMGGVAAEEFNLEAQGVDVAAVSVARCARVSYLTQNGRRDVAEDLALYARLVESGHMSPLEHVARPMTKGELNSVETWDVAFDDGPILRLQRQEHAKIPVVGHQEGSETITYVRGPLYYSGKLNGWISRRAYVRGEHDILGYRAEQAAQ